MTTTHHPNGTITLTSLAELGTVLDPRTLADPPEDTASRPPETSSAGSGAALDLAGLIAQLASMSGGLETMARDDARAREEATVELARYEATAADRDAAEHALNEAQRVRAAAERLAAEAFSDEARMQAAQHVAAARAVELRCTELLAERTRAVEELASRPRLSRLLTERERRAEARREAARRARAERTERLSRGLATVDQMLGRDELDEAQSVIEPLAREFPDSPDVRKMLDRVRWLLRNRLVAPAESAMRDVARRPYRDDPEAAMARLADVQTEGLPEDLARRVFGLWSNACWRVVQRRGWQDPHRETPGMSRGAVWARRPGGHYEVVSSLSHLRWQPGQIVPDGIAESAPPLQPPTTRHRDSASSGY